MPQIPPSGRHSAHHHQRSGFRHSSRLFSTHPRLRALHIPTHQTAVLQPTHIDPLWRGLAHSQRRWRLAFHDLQGAATRSTQSFDLSHACHVRRLVAPPSTRSGRRKGKCYDFGNRRLALDSSNECARNRSAPLGAHCENFDRPPVGRRSATRPATAPPPVRRDTRAVNHEGAIAAGHPSPAGPLLLRAITPLPSETP